MSDLKVGDKVWVQCEVLESAYRQRVKCVNHSFVLHPYIHEIRPVEPVIEACTKTANDQLRQSLMDYPFGEPSNSPKILDSSSEPMRDAFEAEMAERYEWYQGYFSRNENRYFDSSVEMAWQAFQAGAEYRDPSGGWGPTKDEVEYAMDRCGVPASEPLAVGDAVRFVLPGHKRHGTEGILKSIHHGPKNAYLFVSDCGQFHRYCTIEELERYEKVDPIDVKGSMQSLDRADTIQAGDLQWTDRDGKYRLCNFTIGMQVHEAIERGRSHGEKWVFYRKLKEVGE